MGFRYRRSVRVSKRTKVNVGTRHASVSVGEPGMTVNLSRRGARATIGLPGTGLSYVTRSVGGSRRRGSLVEELFAIIFILILLGTIRFIWSLLAGLASAIFLRATAEQPTLPAPTEPVEPGNRE